MLLKFLCLWVGLGKLLEEKSYNIIGKIIILNENLIRYWLILGFNILGEVVLFKKNKGKYWLFYEVELRIKFVKLCKVFGML